MWRWLTGIPRAVRQHLHGPRSASASVCKEDELDEAKKCSKTSDHQYRVQQYRLGAGSQDGSRDNQQDKGEGPDREKGYRPPKFCSQGSCEALGWGTAVVVGLHLTKYHLLIDRWDRDKQQKDKAKTHHCLLYKIANAFPPQCLSKKSIVGNNETTDTAQKKPINSSSELNEETEWEPTPPNHTDESVGGAKTRSVSKAEGVANVKSGTDPLESVMNEFKVVCRNYTCIGQNIAGVKNAMAGHMTQAANLWAEASSSGYGKASFNLGLCYETGRGVKKNIKQAMKYYQRAVKENHSQAMYNLALIYLGTEEVPSSYQLQGLELMENAADLDLVQAQTYMGVHMMGLEQPNIDKAVKYFKVASSQDDPEAEYFLAICYERGLGVEENQCRAADLYSQASSQGHDGATYNLAVFHEYGLGGLPEDKVAAMALYRKAADAGNESAIYRLEGPHHTIPKWKEQFMYDFVEEPHLEPNSGSALPKEPQSDNVVQEPHFGSVWQKEPQFGTVLLMEPHSDNTLLMKPHSGCILQEPHSDPAIQVAPPVVESQQTVLQVTSSISSPSLSDYLRKHLYSLDLHFDQKPNDSHKMATTKESPPSLMLDTASMSLWQPQFARPKNTSPSFTMEKGIVFTLGANDTDTADIADFDDIWENTMVQEGHISSMMQRNNTMPDMRTVTCS